MNAGMLWFDNDPKTSLQAKIERARDYYMHKYFRMPDLVLVHPSMMASNEKMDLGKLAVRPRRYILPHHMLVGVEDKS